jgi:truncated hemoglobin YjbI
MKGENTLNSHDNEHIASLAKEFFSKVQGDEGLQQLLKDFEQNRIEHHPTTFHSHAFGEGNYSNEDIQKAHQNISIDTNHFQSMIDHFVQTLDTHGYSAEDKKKAVEALKGYKEIVIGK